MSTDCYVCGHPCDAHGPGCLVVRCEELKAALESSQRREVAMRARGNALADALTFYASDGVEVTDALDGWRALPGGES